MNAQTMAKRAYANTSTTIRSPRAIEYEAIARITHDLKTAAEAKSENFGAFADAVHRNNQLWTMLAANVVDADNELPAQLRAQLFYLAEFSRRHAAQALAGSSSVAPLLEINTAVLKGLREGKGM